MERRDNSFRTLAADATATTGKSVTIPRTGDTGTTNLSSSSGSSSSLTLSPPNFVSQLHAAIKRPRPLGSMQSKPPRFAARVLVPQGEGASKAGVNPSATQNSEENGMRKQRGALGASRLQNAVPGRNNVDTAVGLLASPLTTPSMLSTITATHNQNAHSSQTKDNFPVTQAAYDQGRKRQELEIAGAAVETDAKYDAANSSQGGIEEACNQNHGDPMTRFSVIGSSATPVSLVCQSNQYTSSMQMPECTVESSAAVPGDVPPKQQGAAMPRTAVVWNPRNQQAPNPVNGAMDKAVSGSGGCLPSQGQGLSANDKSTSAKDDGTSRANMGQKERKKSTYDSEYFFKVNGKRYQKLGKIGSGGSSEVHKVISMDCAIYALKKIKLRGRDYPTAYGFCQEIEYLNKLKGKSNIIQLIDYEVTDKNLLKEGSVSPQGGKIKDDQYIFMVLEFGEIDLANMVAQKWKERTNSIMKIDENWLRFYWQQMLEAVNTIHEERIVHSDLKPANFMLVRGSLKLIDFGIAKAIMNDTTNIQRDSQAGTLNYMSPEAFMCNDQDSDGNIIKCGRPSDIWSLGCILYQMVYGKTPFADYKAFWTKYRAITDRNHKINYEPVDNPWLIDLMQKCLAWDRDERWRIPQLLQHPFLVPLVPGDLPRIDRDPCNKLMARVRLHWDNPEVSRLCSELTNVIARLEEDQSNPTSKT